MDRPSFFKAVASQIHPGGKPCDRVLAKYRRLTFMSGETNYNVAYIEHPVATF